MGTGHSTTHSQSLREQGLAVIFNFEKYEANFARKWKITERTGTKEDEISLTKSLQRFSFKVESHQDLTKRKLLNTIDRYCTSGDVQNYKYLVVCVMTNGNRDGLLLAHDEFYYRQDIWQPFIDCDKLRGIPKNFLFDAWLGNLVEQHGGKIMVTKEEKIIHRCPLTNDPDCLLIFSTMEDHFAFRRDSGSLYIQNLCEVLDTLPTSMELIKLLQNVNKRVTDFIKYDEDLNTIGQTPIIESFSSHQIIVPAFEYHDRFTMETLRLALLSPEDKRKELQKEIQNPDHYNEFTGMQCYPITGSISMLIIYCIKFKNIALQFDSMMKERKYEPKRLELNTRDQLFKFLSENTSNRENPRGVVVLVFAEFKQSNYRSSEYNVLLANNEKFNLSEIVIYMSRCSNFRNKPKACMFLCPEVNFTDMFLNKPIEHKEEENCNRSIANADVIQFFGFGRAICDALYKELNVDQPEDILALINRVLREGQQEENFYLYPHFTSTMRFGFILSTFTCEEEVKTFVKESTNKINESKFLGKPLLEDYDTILNVLTSTLGKNHQLTLLYLEKKSQILTDLGHHSEALALTDWVLHIRHNALDDQERQTIHTDTLTSLHKKAENLYTLGRLHEALEVLNEVIKIRKVVSSTEHFHTKNSLNCKAKCLNQLNHHDEAREVLLDVIVESSLVLVAKHSVT